MRLFLFIVTVIVFFSCKHKEEIFQPVKGRVIDSETLDAIQEARVIYNADTTFITDSNGEFDAVYPLGEYLADSISFYVSKEGYYSRNYSDIVGNTQKDIYVIQLMPE